MPIVNSIIQSADVTEFQLANIIRLQNIPQSNKLPTDNLKDIFDFLYQEYYQNLTASLKIMIAHTAITGRISVDHKIISEISEYLLQSSTYPILFKIFEEQYLLNKVDGVL